MGAVSAATILELVVGSSWLVDGRVKKYKDDELIEKYTHYALAPMFAKLKNNFTNLLTSIIPGEIKKISLMRESDTLYSSNIIETELFEKHTFFLTTFL